ncbi:unnamed protein product [Protopolystoma xenopodis]|uniref:Uncharacterized protein n=1 Tax=Protopolystoma xenopodis TaxID=117903 RepID=A0A448WWJ9_9PLAT|nr:unnamed protein product [Protopolystoma xenopodis]
MSASELELEFRGRDKWSMSASERDERARLRVMVLLLCIGAVVKERFAQTRQHRLDNIEMSVSAEPPATTSSVAPLAELRWGLA